MGSMNPPQTQIRPTATVSPTALADRLGQDALAKARDDHRKQHGQYFTPPAVARFLATLAEAKTETVRLLDPGAGSGVLACAVAEHLAESGTCHRLELDAYEQDADLVPVLRASLDHLGAWLTERGVAFEYRLIPDDFITATAGHLDGAGRYSLVVANPPYYKTGKSHPIAGIPVLAGSPNIYAAFMLAASRLLAEGGRLVFITPRSYASGAYFRTFRRRFFSEVRPDRFHLFGSRRDAFERDELLQEWLVVSGTRVDGWQDGAGADSRVLVSHSGGTGDLEGCDARRVPLDLVLDLRHPELFLRLPTNDSEEAVLRTVDAWEGSLHALGLEVSTGRVVPFRATAYLHGQRPAGRYAPLLWLQHVQAMRVSWPIGLRKPEYIDDVPEDQVLLVPDDNYVLLRRFSSKEQDRRLTAAPLLRGTLGTPSVGIENHMNYIWGRSGDLSPDLARGLALLLNSRLLDRYFRCLNGNTEVSATEVRSLPLPGRDTIEELGRRFGEAEDLTECDRWLEGLPGDGGPGWPTD